MELEWDEVKRQWMLDNRRLDFADVVRFDMETAIHHRDTRTDYGETRFVSTGFLDDRLHVLCWTLRTGRLRIISLRKANDREKKTYTDATGRSAAPR